MTTRSTFVVAALFAVLAAVPALAQTTAPVPVPAQGDAAGRYTPDADAPQDGEAGFDLLSSPWGVAVVIGALILIVLVIGAIRAFHRWVFWGILGLIGRAVGFTPRNW